MHGSTGGGWKRSASSVTAPAAYPTDRAWDPAGSTRWHHCPSEWAVGCPAGTGALDRRGKGTSAGAPPGLGSSFATGTASAPVPSTKSSPPMASRSSRRRSRRRTTTTSDRSEALSFSRRARSIWDPQCALSQWPQRRSDAGAGLSRRSRSRVLRGHSMTSGFLNPGAGTTARSRHTPERAPPLLGGEAASMKAARPKVRQDRGDDESIARGAPLGAAAPLPRGAPPAVTRRPSGEGYANGARRVDRRPIGLRRAEQRRIVALVEHASTLGGSPRSAAVSPVCDCQGGGVPSCHGAELPQASWTTELRGTWWPYDQRHVQLRRRRAEPTRPGDRPKGGNQPGPAGVPGSVRSAPGGHHAQTPAALARPGPRRSGRR